MSDITARLALTATDRGVVRLMDRMGAEVDSFINKFSSLGSTITAVLGGIGAGETVRKAFAWIEDAQGQAAAVATTLTNTVGGSSRDIAEAFQANTRYADRFFKLLQLQSLKSRASFEQLLKAFRQFSQSGLAITADASRVAAFSDLVDKLVSGTHGEAGRDQIMNELDAIFAGRAGIRNKTAGLFALRDRKFMARLKEIRAVSDNAGDEIVSYLNSLLPTAAQSTSPLSDAILKAKDALRFQLQDFFKPLYDECVKTVQQVSDYLRNGNAFSGTFAWMRDALVSSLKSIREIPADIKAGFGGALATVLALTAGIKGLAGALGIVKSLFAGVTAVGLAGGVAGLAAVSAAGLYAYAQNGRNPEATGDRDDALKRDILLSVNIAKEALAGLLDLARLIYYSLKADFMLLLDDLGGLMNTLATVARFFTGGSEWGIRREARSAAEKYLDAFITGQGGQVRQVDKGIYGESRDRIQQILLTISDDTQKQLLLEQERARFFEKLREWQPTAKVANGPGYASLVASYGDPNMRDYLNATHAARIENIKVPKPAWMNGAAAATDREEKAVAQFQDKAFTLSDRLSASRTQPFRTDRVQSAEYVRAVEEQARALRDFNSRMDTAASGGSEEGIKAIDLQERRNAGTSEQVLEFVDRNDALITPDENGVFVSTLKDISGTVGSCLKAITGRPDADAAPVDYGREADAWASRTASISRQMAGSAASSDQAAKITGAQRIQELSGQIAALQREISGETETEAEAKARLRQEQERYNALLPQALQTAQEELDYQRRLLDLRTEGGALNGVKAAVMGYSRDIGSTFDNVKDMALKCIQTVQSSLSDALFNVMTGQFDQFKDFFRSFVNGIIRIWTDAISQLITKWLVLKLALGLGLDIATAGVSAAGSAASSISGGMAQTAANMSETSSALSGMSISLRDTAWASGASGGLHLGGGFANGGIAPGGFHAFANGGMAGGGGVMDLPRIPGLNTAFRAFASGGTVHSPTVGLVGEGRYNEAIVPLPDGRSIPVVQKGPGLNVSVEFPELPEWPALPAAVPQQEAATAGRAAPTVTVNINDNSGNATSKTVNQREDDDGNLIIDVVIDALARNRRGFRRTLQQYAGNNA